MLGVETAASSERIWLLSKGTNIIDADIKTNWPFRQCGSASHIPISGRLGNGQFCAKSPFLQRSAASKLNS
jgi:hypothetical protein